MGKVHCIHCHPSIKCSLNICSFSPSLQKKVWNWWRRIIVIYQIKNCRFVNLALWERSRCHKMIKYWHVYTCCQEINFPYVAVWQTCILKMYRMKLLLHSTCIFFQQYILFLPVITFASVRGTWYIFTDILEVVVLLKSAVTDLIQQLIEVLAWPLTPTRKQTILKHLPFFFFSSYKNLSLRHIDFSHFITSCQNNFPRYMY